LRLIAQQTDQNARDDRPGWGETHSGDYQGRREKPALSRSHGHDACWRHENGQHTKQPAGAGSDDCPGEQRQRATDPDKIGGNIGQQAEGPYQKQKRRWIGKRILRAGVHPQIDLSRMQRGKIIQLGRRVQADDLRIRPECEKIPEGRRTAGRVPAVVAEYPLEVNNQNESAYTEHQHTQVDRLALAGAPLQQPRIFSASVRRHGRQCGVHRQQSFDRADPAIAARP
jgi:hypothetical protein